MTQRFAVAMRSLIWRVTVSVPPPGVKGTTMRIDLAGHSPGWAAALPAASVMAVSAHAAIARRRFGCREEGLYGMVLSPE